MQPWSVILVRLEGRKTSDEFIIRNNRVFVLIEALIEKFEAFLAGIHICSFQVGAHIVNRDISFVLFIKVSKCHVQLDRVFIDDALADELDRNFAFDKASNEAFQEVSGASSKVLRGVRLSAIEPSSGIDQNCVFLFSRHEAVAHLRVAEKTVAVLVELVEDDKDFVLRDGQL